MQMTFGTPDNCVNTLSIADYNLFLLAIPGDIHMFELITQ